MKKFVWCCLLAGLIVPPVPAESRDDVLVLGKVSKNPKKHYGKLKQMSDYVAANMKDQGIRKGQVLMARDTRQMIQYLREGKIDWVGETIFSALLFEQQAGAEILLRRWKKGVPSYRTVFIARKDSGIRKLRDLTGKIIAFEDPGSTSAFFIPMAELLSAGLQLAPLKSPRQKVPAGKVGYVFSRAEINISTWVYKGLVQAGAYSNLNWQDDDDTPKKARQAMTIFHQTGEIPRAVVLVRKGLPPVIKSGLKSVLLRAHQDPAAKPVLQGYQETSKFDRIDKSADLKEARRLFKAMPAEFTR